MFIAVNEYSLMRGAVGIRKSREQIFSLGNKSRKKSIYDNEYTEMCANTDR